MKDPGTWAEYKETFSL